MLRFLVEPFIFTAVRPFPSWSFKKVHFPS
jgi:hypothetical protein